MAGALNRARSLKSLVFVALCDKWAHVGRCEIVAGAGNPSICGCELGADVSLTQRQAASGVSRVRRCAVERSGCDDGRRACRACGACGAVPWGLLLGVSRGWRCAMGIAAGRLAWVSLCHCWAARPLGGAVSWGLLTTPWSGWRRVIRIGEQGVVWVAPCLRDC